MPCGVSDVSFRFQASVSYALFIGREVTSNEVS